PAASAAAVASSAPQPAEESRLSADPEAVTAYRAGLQAMRDASEHAALDAFERATKRDPAFAAAHLRAAELFEADPTGLDQAREHWQSAFQLRADLTPVDRALVDLLEPLMRANVDE